MFFNRLYRLAKEELTRGLSPERLALAFVIGMCVGVTPLLGTTTLLCALFAWGFGLNHALVQAVNYVVYPVQLLLFVPMLALSKAVFGFHELPVSPQMILRSLQLDFIGTIRHFLWLNLGAVALWVVVSLPVGFICYYLLYKAFLKISEDKKQLIKKSDDSSR